MDETRQSVGSSGMVSPLSFCRGEEKEESSDLTLLYAGSKGAARSLQSMDPPGAQSTPPVKEDEWDTDGFVIPSLGIMDSGESQTDPLEVVMDSEQSSFTHSNEESIYLGPHGAPRPLGPRQSELNSKQSFKHKLKEADRRYSGSGRENKVENIRALVGVGTMPPASKSSSKDWLDPHCRESEFERIDHH
ncbi:unnamed protein product [Cuscuta campestris]|uniref:Uncharacterized protein n=1 Tax=Cuscuta campestris TaxID=132261 RepID=A0A484L5N4_9ASTE|nr:unnamed protein product [Cuscuta campestris]